MTKTLNERPQGLLVIDVYFDLDRAPGAGRCFVRPNTLVVPVGTYRLVWNLITIGDGAADRPASFGEVALEGSLMPVVSSGGVSATQWQAEIENPGGELRPEGYHVAVEHGGETVICYPHVIGSPDQGGGG